MVQPQKEEPLSGLTLDLYSHAQREDDLKAASIIGGIMDDEEPLMARVVNL